MKVTLDTVKAKALYIRREISAILTSSTVKKILFGRLNWRTDNLDDGLEDNFK